MLRPDARSLMSVWRRSGRPQLRSVRGSGRVHERQSWRRANGLQRRQGCGRRPWRWRQRRTPRLSRRQPAAGLVLGVRLPSLALITIALVGWVRLPRAFFADDATVTAVRASPFHESIFNGQKDHEAPQRFHGRDDGWAPQLEVTLSEKLDRAGLLTTTDGRRKVVNDCYALKSAPCTPAHFDQPGAADVASTLGWQPAHADFPTMADGRELTDLQLPAADVPLSVMVAIEPGARLWIFPEGCESRENALLVELNLGDILVWRGDIVHAGAGYHVIHYRVHAYVDPPPDIAQRQTGTNLCPPQRASRVADVDGIQLSRGRTPPRKRAAPIQPERPPAKLKPSAAVQKADALLAALQRRKSAPRSPASSGLPSAHSSPSLHADEMSAGFNSEDEEVFNAANPLGLAEDIDDEEDDGEAALAARLEEPEAAREEQAAAVEPPQADGAADNGSADPLERPDAISKTKLLKSVGCAWPTAVYILLSVVGNGLSTAPRMLSLSAEVADPHNLLQRASLDSFHQYVKLGEGQTVNPQAVSDIHGQSFAELQEVATEAVGDVGRTWQEWLQTAMKHAPRDTPFVLTTWKGYAIGSLSLLCTELSRAGLDLPHKNLYVMDLSDVARDKKLFTSAPATLPAMARVAMAEDPNRLRSTSTGASAATRAEALGDLESSTVWHTEPTLLSTVIHTLVARPGRGVTGKAGCVLPLEPFWTYGRRLAAFETQQQHDPEPSPWTPGVPPCEQPGGLEFCAREGSALPHGGPSAALFEAVGLSPADASELPPPGVDNTQGSPNAAARDLMLQVFHFYFPEPEDGGDNSQNVLQRIVDATNEKAMEFVVRERHKGPFRLATEDDPLDAMSVKAGPHARHRAPDMVEQQLTVNELLVYIGIRIVMGAHNPDVLDYCWSTTEDWTVKVIADSMKLDRFKQIGYQLSFIMADDKSNLEGPNAKIRKIFDVTEWLRSACQRAWDPEPDVVPDESRLRLSSRYCTFATTLLCKPIKHGLTIYCLNFCRTRYLYNFEWFTGKQSDHGLGQPTDTTPLNEDNPEEMKYMLGLMDRLITKDLDGTGATVYTDKAFTSFKLARLLAKRRLAIVGMLRTMGRPKLRPMGNEHYWPFRHYSKAEMDTYMRGYRREAHVAVASGDVKWINAQLWKDAKWVTLITTSFFSKVTETVRRWEKSKRARVPIACSLAIKRYNKFMGAVDQFNKELAKTHMAMGRCKQRFHRSLFLGWLLPAVGVVNVRTAFCELLKETWGDAALQKLKKAVGVQTTKFPKWFQLRLGELLIEKGVVQATEANGGESPHFKPQHTKFHWERRLVLPTPPGFEVSHPRREAIDLSLKRCKIPIGWDSKTGVANRWLGGGRDRKRPGGRCQLCGIRALRQGLSIKKNSRFSRRAASHCTIAHTIFSRTVIC